MISARHRLIGYGADEPVGLIKGNSVTGQRTAAAASTRGGGYCSRQLPAPPLPRRWCLFLVPVSAPWRRGSVLSLAEAVREKRWSGQGCSQGGRRGCAPLGFSGPRRARPARAKTPAEAIETLTEVTKPVQKPTKFRAIGAPLTIWAYQKRTGPLWLSESRGPSDSQSHQHSTVTLLNIRAPLIIRDLPTVRGPLNSRGPLIIRGPSKYRYPQASTFCTCNIKSANAIWLHHCPPGCVVCSVYRNFRLFNSRL